MIIGLDVGGTHTDVVLLGPEGVLDQAKIPTDPSDLFRTVLSGLDHITAGVDAGRIDRVREPGYDPDALRQSAAVSRAIERTGELVLDLWRQRDRIRDERRSVGEFEDRNRQIFHDADGIYESQKEKLRICRDCGGALRIDSGSDRGRRILAVHIPIHACTKCREQGYSWYESASMETFGGVYLQDRPEDKYRQKNGYGS